LASPTSLRAVGVAFASFTLNGRQQMVVAFLIGRERASLAYPQNSRPRMHIIVSREL
jgi:hypothetical protein